MLTQIVLAFAALSVGEVPLQVSARLDAEQLVAGQTYAIVVEHGLAPGVATAKIPAPILQIEVPDNVELAGDVLTAHRALAKNEFLQAPFERLLKASPERIEFMLLYPPTGEEAFHLNVLAYVDKSGEQHFVRQRLRLPIVAGASAAPAPAQPSSWGQTATLQLGDKAPVFELPAADGSTVKLADYLGKKNVIITTYRAFW